MHLQRTHDPLLHHLLGTSQGKVGAQNLITSRIDIMQTELVQRLTNPKGPVWKTNLIQLRPALQESAGQWKDITM